MDHTPRITLGKIVAKRYNNCFYSKIPTFRWIKIQYHFPRAIWIAGYWAINIPTLHIGLSYSQFFNRLTVCRGRNHVELAPRVGRVDVSLDVDISVVSTLAKNDTLHLDQWLVGMILWGRDDNRRCSHGRMGLLSRRRRGYIVEFCETDYSSNDGCASSDRSNENCLLTPRASAAVLGLLRSRATTFA
jgi:hypothetical protein